MTGIVPLLIAIVVLSTIVGAFATRNVAHDDHRSTSSSLISLLTSVLLDILLISLFAVGVFAKLFPIWILAVPVSMSIIGLASLVVLRARRHKTI